MAINQNHTFEDLDGIKCAIVEKMASKERVSFLKRILEFNRFTVVVVPSPPPKVAAVPKAAAPAAAAPADAGAAVTPATTVPAVATTPADTPPAMPTPESFTIGVTDVMFNPTNAIFGRLLKAPDGHVVTLAYWYQQEKDPHDEIPYFDNKL